MEFCGFSNNMGPQSAIWSDILTKTFNENATMTDAAPEADIILELPTLKSLLDLAHQIMENPLTKHIGIGVITTAVLCGVWKIQSYRHAGVKKAKKKSPCSEAACNPVKQQEPTKTDTGSVGPLEPPTHVEISHWTNTDCVQSYGGASDRGDLARNSLEGFQRQLLDVLTKLDQARLQLNELEGDKDLLAAELEVRQKALIALQIENKEEREKRQRAEMKMELMDYENSQLKKMRRELSLKAGQLERLARCVKEKEEYQEKLFQENVVLPRSVAQARTKEFNDMQARLQVLEARLIGIRSDSVQPESIRSFSTVSSFDDRPDFSTSELSMLKVRRIIKAPEWSQRSASETRVTDVVGSPTFPTKGQSPISKEPPNDQVIPEESSMASKPFDTVARDEDQMKVTSKDGPHKDCEAVVVSSSVHSGNQKGIISKIKAFVKGYSDSSLDSANSDKTNLRNCFKRKDKESDLTEKDGHKNTKVPLCNMEESKAPSIPEVLSAGTVFLSASGCSTPDNRSPEVFESFTVSKNGPNTSPSKRPAKTDSLKSTKPTVSKETISFQKSTERKDTSKLSKNLNPVVMYRSATSSSSDKSRRFSSKEFQVRYQPKSKGMSDEDPLETSKKETGESESEDSWCVIVPK